MGRLNWILLRAVRRLGYPGIAGVMAILAAAVLHAFMLSGEPPRIEALRTAVASLRAGIEARRLQPVAPTVVERLALFHRDLPLSTATRRMEVMARIQAAAMAEGLVLEEASYRLSFVSAETLDSLQIELPLKVDYGPLRRFVARVLHDTPALALEALSINRTTVADPAVEVQLRFMLYMRSP
jgi:hypothetical protein